MLQHAIVTNRALLASVGVLRLNVALLVAARVLRFGAATVTREGSKKIQNQNRPKLNRVSYLAAAEQLEVASTMRMVCTTFPH